MKEKLTDMPNEDRKLLERLVHKDPQAIGDIFERHGKMVYNVCLRVLGNATTADDATQATFLVLMRKGTRLSRRTILSAWLYRTAEFVARRALRTELRRRKHEKDISMITQKSNNKDEENAWETVRPELDEAVANLPEKWQTPVILTYFEGYSRADTARILGIPEGTVKSRLSRALQALRRRLAKRKASISLPALAVLLASRTAEASVPSSVGLSLLPAAQSFYAGAAGIGIKTTVKVMEVAAMKAMFHSKVVFCASLLASVVLTAAVSVPATLHIARADTKTEKSLLAEKVADLELKLSASEKKEKKFNSQFANLRKRLAASEVEKALVAGNAAKAIGEIDSGPGQGYCKFIKSGNAELDKLLAGFDWDEMAKLFLEMAKTPEKSENPDAETTAMIGKLFVLMGSIAKAMGYPTMVESGNSPILRGNALSALLRQKGYGLSESQQDELAELSSEVMSRIKQINDNKDSIFKLEYISQITPADMNFVTKFNDLLTQEQKDSLKEHEVGAGTPFMSSPDWRGHIHDSVSDLDEAKDVIYERWKESFAFPSDQDDVLRAISDDFVEIQQQVRDRYGAGPDTKLPPMQQYEMEREIIQRQIEALKKVADLNLTDEQLNKVKKYGSLDTFSLGEGGSPSDTEDEEEEAGK